MTKQEILDDLKAAAFKVGTTLEEQAVKTIADLHTSARNSIVAVGLVAFVVGVFFGAMIW
jgi:hypothetical protein